VFTVAKLKTRTAKDLASLAKRKGIAGWHAMRKDQLIHALLRLDQPNGHSRASKNGHSQASKASRTNGSNGCVTRAKKTCKGSNGDAHAPRPTKARPPRTERRLTEMRARLLEAKDLALHSAGNNGHSDRLVAMVRDPYWLQAYWELSRQSVERARAALGQHWHGARPVLRVLQVARDGTTSSVRKVIREIEIHGSVDNWYIDVDAPPKSFQMEIGYRGPGDRFVCLARSNIVTTPAVGAIKGNGSLPRFDDDYDRIFALSGGYSGDGDQSDLKELFEQRLRRPLGGQYMVASSCPDLGKRQFSFEVDAALVVFGATEPDARVTLKGEPVPLDSDGSFQIRFNLPDRRQVFPVVASSGDGVEQRTIVLAVERNTKVMEPVIREPEA
jgi:hypothetical protein